MTVANHAALGALIALTVKEPALVLPLAFVSHYALDALPHFGYPGGGGFGEAFKHKLTLVYGIFDSVTSIIFIILILNTGWLVYVAAATAVAPDIANFCRYYFKERKGLSKPSEGNIISRFHHRIQWGHRPWGLFVESAMTAFLFVIIAHLK
ncbi:MAG: hypothetical protein Q7R60_02610 [bacterium]|nr:hypothetical protein [bacterium]